jgi:hypothetical protein
MIGQYLPNNNENATVPILQKILHLNRALFICHSTPSVSNKQINREPKKHFLKGQMVAHAFLDRK